MTENYIEAGRTIDETLQLLGYPEFRDHQREAILNLLNKHDTLVVLSTGSGKSLIYEIAALHLPGVTLVVSPLIALMQDQVDKLEELNVPATFINSSLADEEQTERLERMVAGEYKIVYVTPERLRQQFFHEQVEQLQVSLLAVDEAHSVSEWGHDFRPEYLHIKEFREFVGNPVTVALTATATERVRQEIIDFLGLTDVRYVYGPFDRPNIKLSVVQLSNGEKVDEAKLDALADVFAQRSDTVAIIYVGRRKDAEKVASFLREQFDIEAKHYHAGMTPKQRTAVQEAFMEGELPVVAATNAFGMGIDRQDVRLIVHHTIPGSLDAYYQEVGRAGRDGKPAEAILLYNRTDRKLHEYFIRQGDMSYQKLKRLYRELTEDEHAAEGDRVVVRNKGAMGLERLEEAGVIEQGEYEGLDHEIYLKEWDSDAVKEEVEKVEAYGDRKWVQLEEMVKYGENTNHCRRALILEHLGEEPPDAPRPNCCDVCDEKLEVAEFVSEIEREAEETEKPVESESPPPLAETILACVHTFNDLRTPQQMVDLLHGDEKGYNVFHRSEYHGKLAHYSRDEIQREINRLLEERKLRVGKLETLSV